MKASRRQQLRREKDDAETVINRLKHGDLRLFVVGPTGSVSTIHTLLSDSQLWKLQNIISAWMYEDIDDINRELEEDEK